MLDLDAVADGSLAVRDQQALTAFREADNRHGLTVSDVAAGALRVGKATLTTYHSAKGREWDVVILPGLIDGIMPDRRWSKARGTHLEPTPDRLEQDRRLFYVGLTRAKTVVVLMYGNYWEKFRGNKNNYGISRFARDILTHLDRNGAARQTART
jgi:DNA helicase-2/ATP-dependent DNA helicase PcrA